MNLFNFIPAELITIFVAASPISELRGAIPLAIGVYHFGVIKTFLLAVLGNLIPAVVLLWLLGPVSGFLIRTIPVTEKFFDWLFARTRHKFSGRYERLGELALLFFVAIPLPMTGVWTGSVATFLFGIPKKRALLFISLGAVLAGFIVTVMTLGAVSLF
ncbi:MAG TPA: small multi-drug export protein [Candidatus Paceibacterota bacterium]|nr:small multi-drug export protein [Candidatus Paceibacterota bacterium]